ncbi:hypothetical protein Acr_24g0005720 [Actinidia rufa]|uniref:Uncharacterized protein n=1 Tax=Actinidia rufa TaxID=165716 RepID=A0A7J0GUB7_9ERIC|nr:hypothetical protein Acr_24g0005720 [Actinidia rufa]
MEVETLLHGVRDYRFAKDVFISFNQEVLQCSGINVQEWLRNVSDSFCSNEFAFTLMVCWRLWGNQNDVVHNNNHSSAEGITKSASEILVAFVEMNR